MSGTLFTKRIAFYGAGSMAEAIIRGLVTGRIADPALVTAINRSGGERLQKLRDAYGVRTAHDQAERDRAIREADIVVLGIKPKDAAAAIAAVRSLLRTDQMLVSLVAGMSIETMAFLAGCSLPIVRTMPNTSSSIGLGATGVSLSAGATDEQRELALEMFGAIGIAVLVDEDKLDIVTGVSGSGPAYVYYMIEALIRGGVKGGLAEDTARELAVQTVLGAASMVKATGESPAELRRKVTSPNGTTQAALETLDRLGFPEAVARAVARAAERAGEMGATVGEAARLHFSESGGNEK